MTKIISSSLLSKELQKRIKFEVSNLKQSKKVISKTELSEEAKAFLNKAVKGTWTQRGDGKIDVKGSVSARFQGDAHLFLGKEIFFGEVGGDFDWVSNSQITSLKGAPEEIEGDFSCVATKITSLEGAPKKVGGDFKCSYTYITSLEGAPIEVGGDFFCNATIITSLEGAPKKVGGDFNCGSVRSITSLEGAPKEVGGDFDCDGTNITSLEGAPKEVGGNFNCSFTKITSLEGAPKKVGGYFSCYSSLTKSLKGAPEKVGGRFDCRETNITSLKGSPREVGGDFDCSETKITSLEGAPEKVGGSFTCYDTKITSLEGIGEVKGEIYSDFKQTLLKQQTRPEGQKMSVEKLLPYFVNEYKVLEKENQNSILSEFTGGGTGDSRYDFEYDINENKKEQAKNMKDIKETVSKLIKILKKEGINEVTVSYVDEIPVDTEQFGSDLKNGEGGSYTGLGNIYAINNIPESLIESLNYYHFAGTELLYEPYEDNSYPENTFFFVLGASELTIIAKEYDEDEEEDDEDDED